MGHKVDIAASPNGREIVITREFDAPRERVWEAHVDPELVKQWLGPRGLEMKIKSWNMEPGGSYRYIHKDTDGNEYEFHGVIHGVYFPEKIIQTFEFDGLPEPGHVTLDTLILKELSDEKTKLTTISVFQTPEDREAMLQSGMEKGVIEGYEQLDDLLAA